MTAYNGLDNVKAKTPAIPVLGAAFIQLVEAVEKQRQLLRGNGLALVGDADVDLIASGAKRKGNFFFLRAEFDGIIQKVINDLGNGIRIRHGKHRIIRQIHLYMQLLLQDLLTAKGRSYSDPVYHADGTVNMDASRRVEFKFRLKDSEMIDEMNRILSQMEE